MFKAFTFARVRRLVNLNATALNFAVRTIKALVLRRGVTLVLPMRDTKHVCMCYYGRLPLRRMRAPPLLWRCCLPFSTREFHRSFPLT